MSPHARHDWEVVLKFDKNNKLLGAYTCKQKGNKLRAGRLPSNAKQKYVKNLRIAVPADDENGGLVCPPGYCKKIMGGYQYCIPC